MVLLFLSRFQILCQSVELFFPERAVVLNPRGSVFHRLGNEPAAVHAAVNLPPEEAGGLEHAEMLGDGRQGHREGFGQSGHRGFTVGEARKDGAAGGIGEGGEGRVERPGGIVNHMV